MEASFVAIQFFGQLFPTHPFTLAESVGKRFPLLCLYISVGAVGYLCLIAF
ncbi:hypothetical protein AB6F55_13780 [Providencia hangzhouensis]